MGLDILGFIIVFSLMFVLGLILVNHQSEDVVQIKNQEEEIKILMERIENIEHLKVFFNQCEKENHIGNLGDMKIFEFLYHPEEKVKYKFKSMTDKKSYKRNETNFTYDRLIYEKVEDFNGKEIYLEK